MTIDAITVGALAVIFLSCVMRSTFGFGDAMLSMLLLSILLGIHTATPLVMYGTMRHWSAESFRATLQGFSCPPA